MPPALGRALTLLRLLRTYPGYTLATLMAEDMELLRLEAITDPDIGKATDTEAED